MVKIIFYTTAYNAEQTINRAVDSILGQTYSNFIYYLLDNGSTDRTWDIVREYSKSDARIVPLHNDVNMVFTSGNSMHDVVARHRSEAESYFGTLDADDEYASDFLEKAISFLQSESLDVVCVGSDYIDETNEKVVYQKCLPERLVVEGDGFSSFFQDYYMDTKVYWSKLFAINSAYDVIIHPTMRKFSSAAYGWDTAFVIGNFLRAKRVGFLPDILHRHYASPTMRSRSFHTGRAGADALLFDLNMDFLTKKCGYVSQANENYIYSRYLDGLIETTALALRAEISAQEKLGALYAIFMDEHIHGLFGKEWLPESKKHELADAALVFLLNAAGDDILPDDERFLLLGERLAAFVEDMPAFLYFKKRELSFLLASGRANEARGDILQLARLMPQDKELKKMKKKFR